VLGEKEESEKNKWKSFVMSLTHHIT
jgi:hypothetical protein